MSSGIEWQHPNCQFNVKIQFYPQNEARKFSVSEGGRVATGEDTLLLTAGHMIHQAALSTNMKWSKIWSEYGI